MIKNKDVMYTSAYYAWLSKKPENTPPVEQAENTPNWTHFRAVVDNQIPAYSSSQTLILLSFGRAAISTATKIVNHVHLLSSSTKTRYTYLYLNNT